MNRCSCCEDKTMIGVGGNYTRPRLFNWITIVLVTAWVVLVGIVAETSRTRVPGPDETTQTFVKSLMP